LSEGTSIYFLRLGLFNDSLTKSTPTSLTKVYTFLLSLSENMNETFITNTKHDIIKKKLAKNTESFIAKLSIYRL
jgi:hypothetical protein